ncbi:hypothetical protein [Rhizobium indicum]|uniref:Uncharacterized protein n=1 Tax=Rhizobium indicum TaxID=2583231 RepID=A0ABX6PB52_9HYPH|nr:hypothetical protein [Rhizobium indicum]QKK15422.1 hypothetical protein FFM53_003040 [Rhizobium indicum]
MSTRSQVGEMIQRRERWPIGNEPRTARGSAQGSLRRSGWKTASQSTVEC